MTIRPDHIDHWIFDLDNTLYPPELGLFARIDQRMGAFIMERLGCDALEARTVQKRYFHDHGTTLAGMMRYHDVAPAHFLSYVHDIPMDDIPADDELATLLAKLPGDRHIFTNADADYAQQVLERRGIAHLFSTIIDIHAVDYAPKPEPAAYAAMARLVPGFDATRALFVDDMSRNLAPARAMGMVTVWLDNGSESGDRGHDPAHVDHHIDDLVTWLKALVH